MRILSFLLFTLFSLGMFACAKEAETTSIPTYTVHILRTLPHNPENFTQGFLYHAGKLYESTGLYGHSSLQELDALTGRVLRSVPAPDVFAEGLVLWQNRLIQLTWKRGVAYVYALDDFSRIGSFQYDTEGWGLTTDGTHLIMSDGSDTLSVRDPFTFQVIRRIQVTFQGRPVFDLNELEYIDGLIYANIWHERIIVQIDPVAGAVVGIIDAAPLFEQLPPLDDESVLNGIAYNPDTHTLYLTGKRWPTIFEVRFP